MKIFRNTVAALLLTLIVSLLVAGCGGGGSTGSGTGSGTSATLVSIAVTPASAIVAAGSTQQMTATGTYSDSSTKDITASVTWTSSNASAATVTNPGGQVSGVSGGGDSVITAASGAVSGNTMVTVPINKIFVAEQSNLPEVEIYPRMASGTSVTASAVISSTATFLEPSGIMVDRLHSEIAVLDAGGTANTPSIQVFKLTDGSAPASPQPTVTPQRVIAGNNTGLNNPWGVYVDSTNNEIYVANYGGSTITVYKRTDNGNVTPQRTISSTAMSGPTGVSVDIANNLIYVADYNNNDVLVFDRTANGPSTPVKVISSTGLLSPNAAIVDHAHSEFYVPYGTTAGAVAVFPASTPSSTTATPGRTLTGAATGLNTPYSVSVDNTDNEIAVANNTGASSGSITVYSRTASGNTGPLRKIQSGTLYYPAAVDEEP